ncbi:MAG: uroporphyrinogen decarboxylase family protein [Armatimonadota bacterium]|nr:uroporphyrinogen decarboxylase family protein [Armatimonadota bacterium]
MNARERFLKICNFEQVDHPPRWDCLGFWNSTVQRWWQEGLPKGMRPEQYFEMDAWEFIPVDAGFTHNPYRPPFEHQVLEEDEFTITYRDGQGIVKRDRKDNAELSMSQFIEFPVSERKDWENLKWRLNPCDPERYPNWDELRKKIANRSNPVGMAICGGYGFPRNLFGEEKLAYVYYDDPALVHDIMEHWANFYIGIFDRTLPNVELDFVYIWEDMAFKNGPLIGPNIFREFMLPYYKEVIASIRSKGVTNIIVDSDGDNRPLLDLFIEAGVNVFFPLEIAAGMEPIPIREKYGRKLVLWGGIDKRVLAKGKAEIEHELLRKVPRLIDDGGYIPAIDHSVPPDVPFENYKFYIELLRKITER